MFLITKILVSAVVIGIVTEIARYFPKHGGIIAALPLVTVLSLIWLSVQGEEPLHLSQFALGVLWGIPATVVFITIIAVLVKASFSIVTAMGLGFTAWLLCLWLQNIIIGKILA